MEILDRICKILAFILSALVVFKIFYIVIGFFFKAKKYPKTDIQKKYAILIPARNEEKVLPHLIDSIYEQSYDLTKLTIFVVADNCDDNTAQIAREKGCIVYERFDKSKARKGYALDFLLQNIEKDYRITSFDGYFVFDADNLLKKDFIEKMNEAFVAYPDIVIGYRNSKNFDTNFVSSAYAIHFYNSSLSYHRPRSLLHLGTHLAGTGFVISSEIVKDGWKWHNLTEDAELAMYLNQRGIKIQYCEEAIFYDEQPTSFKIAFRQRIRWSKGRLQVFAQYGFSAIKRFFKTGSFTSYDLFWYMFPYALLSTALSIIYPLITLILSIIHHNFDAIHFLKAVGVYFGGQYLSNLFTGALVCVREHKQIHCSFFKTILYLLLWPWFNMIGTLLLVCALLKKEVIWKPIPHNDTRTIQDIK